MDTQYDNSVDGHEFMRMDTPKYVDTDEENKYETLKSPSGKDTGKESKYVKRNEEREKSDVQDNGTRHMVTSQKLNCIIISSIILLITVVILSTSLSVAAYYIWISGKDIRVLQDSNLDLEQKYESVLLQSSQGIRDLKEDILDLQQKYGSVLMQAPIGFYAFATSTQSLNTRGVDVFYRGVISNFGGHYDATSSKFTCPVDGVYMFAVNILTPGNKASSLRIVHNDTVIGVAYADDEPGNNHVSAASTVTFIECKVNETVKVISDCCCVCELRGSDSIPFSTFSGWLLYRNNTNE